MGVLDPDRGETTERTPFVTYDPLNPGLSFDFTAYTDVDGNSVDVDYDKAAFDANNSRGLLLLHHHNAMANRAEAILLNTRAGKAWRRYR